MGGVPRLVCGAGIPACRHGLAYGGRKPASTRGHAGEEGGSGNPSPLAPLAAPPPRGEGKKTAPPSFSPFLRREGGWGVRFCSPRVTILAITTAENRHAAGHP